MLTVQSWALNALSYSIISLSTTRIYSLWMVVGDKCILYLYVNANLLLEHTDGTKNDPLLSTHDRFVYMILQNIYGWDNTKRITFYIVLN